MLAVRIRGTSAELRDPSRLHSLERINIRVIDPFTIKPLDHKTIVDNARVTRGRIITVEDHYYEGEGRKIWKNSAVASTLFFPTIVYYVPTQFRVYFVLSFSDHKPSN